MATPTIIKKPERWDSSFDPEMSEADVDRLQATAPFRDMDENLFSKNIPLRGILQHDTRIRRFGKGELIVRQDDYGNSAFLILKGTTRVVLKPELPGSVLGRRDTRKKGIFRALAQIWSSWREPESYRESQLRPYEGIDARQTDGDKVGVFLQDLPRILDKHQTAEMHEGDFFGENAALSRTPRTATIFADGDVELLEIRWQGLRELMRREDELNKHIDAIYRDRALRAFLRNIPTFRRLSPEQENIVVAETVFATYGEYDWSGDYKKLMKSGGAQAKEPIIATAGDYPNGMLFVRSGFARLSEKYGNGERTLNYLGAGQQFGFREIAHNWRHPGETLALKHSLRAIGYTHVIIVPTAVMEKIVLPSLSDRELPEPFPSSEDRIEMDAPQPASSAADRLGSDMMEFISENRFSNGTATMLIDLDRCTRCDDCVRACASTHDNNPRFLRHGPTNGKIMVANACMHCADPVCMLGCPTGAIHRESAGGQVVINPVTCVGCSLCANNCPYTAIRMVDIRLPNGAFMMDEKLKPIPKATKCDLCVENYGGPACERACPHGALTRMNMSDLDSFAAWLKK